MMCSYCRTRKYSAPICQNQIGTKMRNSSNKPLCFIPPSRHCMYPKLISFPQYGHFTSGHLLEKIKLFNWSL